MTRVIVQLSSITGLPPRTCINDVERDARFDVSPDAAHTIHSYYCSYKKTRAMALVNQHMPNTGLVERQLGGGSSSLSRRWRCLRLSQQHVLLSITAQPGAVVTIVYRVRCLYY